MIDWIAYGHTVQTTRDKSTFGQGEVRGVIGPESSNNAKEGGALIPTLLFGIPGSGTTAVLLAAARYGFDPGRFVAVSPMAHTRTMTGWYGQMTGFSQAVVARMRVRLEGSVGFRWDEIEPLVLAKGFSAETLVIHDHDDLELPATEGRALARTVSTGGELLTEGLGHRRILRDTAVVAAATKFMIGESAWNRGRPTTTETNAASAA